MQRDGSASHTMAVFAELERHAPKPIAMYRKLLSHAVRQLEEEAAQNAELRREIAAAQKHAELREGRVRTLETYVSKLRQEAEDGVKRRGRVRGSVGQTSVSLSAQRRVVGEYPTGRSSRSTARRSSTAGKARRDFAESPTELTGGECAPVSRSASHSPFCLSRSGTQDCAEGKDTLMSSSLRFASFGVSGKRKQVGAVRRTSSAETMEVIDKILVDVFVLLLSDECPGDVFPQISEYRLPESTRARCSAVFSAIVRLREEVAATRRRNDELQDVVQQKESLRMLATAAAEEHATLEMLRAKGCGGIDTEEYVSAAPLEEPSAEAEGCTRGRISHAAGHLANSVGQVNGEGYFADESPHNVDMSAGGALSGWNNAASGIFVDDREGMKRNKWERSLLTR